MSPPPLFEDGRAGIVVVAVDGAARLIEFDPATGQVEETVPLGPGYIAGGLGGSGVEAISRRGDGRLTWVRSHSSDMCGPRSPEGHMMCTEEDDPAWRYVEGVDEPVERAGHIVPSGDQLLRLVFEGGHSRWELVGDDGPVTLPETDPITDGRFSPDGRQVALVAAEFPYVSSERIEVRAVADPCIDCPTTKDIDLGMRAYLTGWLDDRTLVVLGSGPENTEHADDVGLVDVDDGRVTWTPGAFHYALANSDGRGRMASAARYPLYPYRPGYSAQPPRDVRIWEDGEWAPVVLPPLAPEDVINLALV